MNAKARTRPASTTRPRALAVSLALHAGGIAGALSLGGTAAVAAAWSAQRAVPSGPLEVAAPMPTAAVAAGCPLPPVLAEPSPAAEPDDALSPWLPPMPLAAAEPAASDAPWRAPRQRPTPDWLARLRREAPVGAAPERAANDPPAAADDGAQVPPSLLQDANAPPAYPLAAWRRGIEGRVVVVLEIDANGQVSAAHVEISSGSSLLDDAALGALAAWRFQPALLHGHPVRSTHRQEVVFRLDGGPAAR